MAGDVPYVLCLWKSGGGCCLWMGQLVRRVSSLFCDRRNHYFCL